SVDQGYELLAGAGAPDLLQARIHSSSGASSSTQATGLNDGQYHHAALAISASSYVFIVDGAVVGGGVLAGDIVSTQNLFLALRGASDATASEDEVQLHTTPRSAAWITTEFNQSDDPATFATAGTPEDAGGDGGEPARFRRGLPRYFR